ncbi:MAG: nucleotide exchange factor GrpE, partial [Gemmatimonadales bacterium]
ALAEAERLRDEYLDQLRRARADYDNLNKRKTRELMDALDRGAAQLASQLLGALDNFSLALDAARSSEDEQLAKGVDMVHQGLFGVLAQAGLEEVPGVGSPFDPAWHEALAQVEAPEPVDEPVVAEVLRTGYRFKGRVLRPASVKVAR